jgi:hypothetical protein
MRTRRPPVGRRRLRGLAPAFGPAILLSLLAMATISSGAVLLFDLPRPFMLSLGFTALLLYLVHLRLSNTALAFVVAYLASIALGSASAIVSGQFELPSSIQLFSALITFVAVASYVADWLRRGNDAAKLVAVERVLFFFLIFSVIDIIFYKEIGKLRQEFYQYNIISSIDRSYNRDVQIYLLPRPVCFFSEASNFARFIGIMIAYYMHLSRFSRRSIAWLVLFVVVARSTSMFFAAPVMMLALYRSLDAVTALRARLRSRRVPTIVGAVLIILAVAAFSQAGRFGGRNSDVRDGSAASRLGTPIAYVWTEWAHPIIGSGATPQRAIDEFVLSTEIANGRAYLASVEGVREGTAPAISALVGMGMIGLLIFVVTLCSLMGLRGLLVIGSFFVATVVSAGFNSVAMWVPWAMIFPMLASAQWQNHKGTSKNRSFQLA